MSKPGEETPAVVWVAWAPRGVAHVAGRYEPRRWDPETRTYEEQRVEARCSYPGCGAEFRRSCSSGRVRELIATFASVHLHRDPLDG